MLTHEKAHVIMVTDVRLGVDEADDVRESRELRLRHGMGIVALLLCAFSVGDPALEAVPRHGQSLRRHGFGGFAAAAAAAALFGGGLDEGGQIRVEAR